MSVVRKLLKDPFLAFENKTLGRLNRAELGHSSLLEVFLFKDESISRSMLGAAFSYLWGALEQCCGERDGQQWHVFCSGRVPSVRSFRSTEEQGSEAGALRYWGLGAQLMNTVGRDARYLCSVTGLNINISIPDLAFFKGAYEKNLNKVNHSTSSRGLFFFSCGRLQYGPEVGI